MDFYAHSFRKHLFKTLSRRFVKNALANIKDLDVLVYEYCLITLREELNYNRGVYQVIKVENLFNKFDSIVKDLEEINTNLSNLNLKVFNKIGNYIILD